MNRLRKIGAALAVAGMLATYVPSGLVLAQVNPNSPIEVSVDILLQVDAKTSGKCDLRNCGRGR